MDRARGMRARMKTVALEISHGGLAMTTDDAIAAALRSENPANALFNLVLEWKAQGCNQARATERLSQFLAQLPEGAIVEDGVVRDVLDFVVGFCSPDRRIFP